MLHVESLLLLLIPDAPHHGVLVGAHAGSVWVLVYVGELLVLILCEVHLIQLLSQALDQVVEVTRTPVLGFAAV